MPNLIEVWDSWLGIAEVAGPKHNGIILQWWKDVPCAWPPEIVNHDH